MKIPQKRSNLLQSQREYYKGHFIQRKKFKPKEGYGLGLVRMLKKTVWKTLQNKFFVFF